jgi:peptidyl-prolyl cis-trans isomerase SurA
MIKRNSFIILSFFCFFLVSIGAGQEKPKSYKIDTLAVLGDEVITVKDYEDFFLKNNNQIGAGSKVSDEKKLEFLDLLIRYRLKIKIGKKYGMLDLNDVKNEIAEYRQKLAVSYILNKEIFEPNLKLLYERRKTNLKIAAILLKVNWSDPADSINKFNLANSIIDNLNKGADFEALARKYSNLVDHHTNSALLGYVSAGQTVSPKFEDAIYNLTVGKITQAPVKIPRGYIIAKLLDIEPRTGGRKFAHILLQFKNNTREDSLTVFEKAEKIFTRLKNGESLEKLAAEYSDDQTTRNNGGIIGLFERDAVWNNPEESLKAGFSYEFINKAFSLKLFEVSDPVKDQQGIHIIKYIESSAYPSFDSICNQMKEEYTIFKYEKDYRSFIEKIKSNINLKQYDNILNKLYSQLDTNKTTNYSNWDESVEKGIKKEKVFTFMDDQKSEKPVIIADMIGIINNNDDFRGIPLSRDGYEKIINKLSDFIAMDYLLSRIDRDHPDFQNEMKSFVDELLLFRVNSTLIWNRIAITDLVLKNFYDSHSEIFRTASRVNLTEIHLSDDSTAKAVYDQLINTRVKGKNNSKNSKSKKKNTDFQNFDIIASKYTTRKNYKETKGLWILSENENILAEKAKDLPIRGISMPFAFENGYSIIRVNSKEPSCQKKYQECGSELTEKYREFEIRRIENDLIDSLKNEIQVKILKEKIKYVLSDPESK